MNGDINMKAQFLKKQALIKFAIIVFTILTIGLGGCEKRRDYNTDQKDIISSNQPDSTTKKVLKNNIPGNEEKKLSSGRKETGSQNRKSNQTGKKDTSTAGSYK
jgi:hypothetical protein